MVGFNKFPNVVLMILLRKLNTKMKIEMANTDPKMKKMKKNQDLK